MTSRVSITLAICVIAALGAVAALGLSGGSSTPAAAPAAAPAPGAAPTGESPRVEIQNFAFTEGVTVDAGSALTVANIDGAPHTLTASDGSFNTGTIGSGDSAAITVPSTPGTFAFFCEIHPSMTGSLTVA